MKRQAQTSSRQRINLDFMIWRPHNMVNALLVVLISVFGFKGYPWIALINMVATPMVK